METQKWDDRGRLTVRPEYRERLGDAEFFQVLTPSGLLFVPIPDKPLKLKGTKSTDDHSKIAEGKALKDWDEKHARIRGHKPRHRSH